MSIMQGPSQTNRNFFANHRYTNLPLLLIIASELLLSILQDICACWFCVTKIHRLRSLIMPSKFAKVQKRVNKKKGGTNALHENSRDAMRLQSAVQRDDKVTRLGAVREKINEPHRESINKTTQAAPID